MREKEFIPRIYKLGVVDENFSYGIYILPRKWRSSTYYMCIMSLHFH